MSENKPTLKQTIGSVLAAFIGVQNSQNRERDFQGGSAKRFVLVGVISTILLVVAILIIVGFVMILIQ